MMFGDLIPSTEGVGFDLNRDRGRGPSLAADQPTRREARPRG